MRLSWPYIFQVYCGYSKRFRCLTGRVIRDSHLIWSHNKIFMSLFRAEKFVYCIHSDLIFKHHLLPQYTSIAVRRFLQRFSPMTLFLKHWRIGSGERLSLRSLFVHVKVTLWILLVGVFQAAQGCNDSTASLQVLHGYCNEERQGYRRAILSCNS